MIRTFRESDLSAVMKIWLDTNIKAQVDNATKHLKLSIKNMNYNDNNHGTRIIKENINGFLPLHNKLDEMIKETLKEMNKSSKEI